MTETLTTRITPTHGMKGAKRWGYISRQKTIRLATTDEDGGIYLSPLWFVVHDKRIFLPLDAGSRHAKNSEAGRALAAVIDSGDEYATVHGIRFTGSLKAVEDTAFVDTVMELIFEKYFYDGHPYAESYFQFGIAAGRRILELVTKKAVGWDMRETSLPTVPEARVLPDFVTDRLIRD
jgi:hypothetical protein